MRTVKIEAVAMESIVGDARVNCYYLEKSLKIASSKGCNLAIFPEMNISGYITDYNMVADFIEQSGFVSQLLCDYSKKYNIAFTSGWPVVEDAKFYIAQFLFFNGEVIGCHRKTHLAGSENEIYTPGNKLEVFSFDGVNVAMQLCFESHMPEISYQQTKKGAHIIAMGFASPRETSEEKLERFKRFIPARAYDNSCFVVAVNQGGIYKSGKQFAPVSLICDAKGKVLNESVSATAGACAGINLEQISDIRKSSMGWFNNVKRDDILGYA